MTTNTTGEMGIDLRLLKVSALKRLRDWFLDTIERTGTDKGYERSILAISQELKRRENAERETARK